MSRTYSTDGKNELRTSAEKAQPQSQTAKWERRWGEGKSDAEYKELDATYISLASEYKGAITPRLEMNLIEISRFYVERRKASDAGNFQDVQRLTTTINTIMGSEAMRAGDAKPLEKFRVDTLADKMEQRGLMKDGVLSLEGVISYIRTDKGKFLMSRDAVDAMMLSMLNAYRFNEGMSEFPELPKPLKAQDPLGELEPVSSLEEKNLMTELGMGATWDGGPR